MQFMFSFLLGAISLFLILLILVQRGRGGGLTGALGGMGGQSAFGTKAGDAFTRITIISAAVWLLTAILAVKLLGGKSGPLGDADAVVPVTSVPAGADTDIQIEDILSSATDDGPAADTGSSAGGIGTPAGEAPTAETDPVE